MDSKLLQRIIPNGEVQSNCHSKVHLSALARSHSRVDELGCFSLCRLTVSVLSWPRAAMQMAAADLQSTTETDPAALSDSLATCLRWLVLVLVMVVL